MTELKPTIIEEGNTMTPQERVDHLLNKYFMLIAGEDPCVSWHQAVQCAMIAVDTHLYSENNSPFGNMAEWKEDNQYWQEVKRELKRHE